LREIRSKAETMKNTATFFLFTSLLFGCQENVKTETDSESNQTDTEVIVTEAITITPIEHATAVVQMEGLTIYMDPTGGADAFKGQPIPDLVLITDIHGDHLNIETLDALDLSKARIIVPRAVADKLPSKYIPQLHIISNGEIREFKGIQVEAVSMYNLREEALEFHPEGRGNGYILISESERIYFSGDTEDIPEMRALENIDKAFICMNLPYTMTVESAASAVLEFKPKQVYPYHYRGKPDVSDVKKFKQLVNDGDPSIEVVQLDWYPKMEY